MKKGRHVIVIAHEKVLNGCSLALGKSKTFFPFCYLPGRR